MMNEGSLLKQSQSSLPVQVLIFFNWHFMAFFFFINLGLFTYKSAKYYYPSYYLGWDITIDFLYAIVESTRLLLASKANKTASASAMSFSLLLGLPILVTHSYLITLQTYVLRVDIVINAIAFILVGLEMIACALTLSQIFLASRKF